MKNVKLMTIDGPAKKIKLLIKQMNSFLGSDSQPRMNIDSLKNKSVASAIFGDWINLLLDIAELSHPQTKETLVILEEQN